MVTVKNCLLGLTVLGCIALISIASQVPQGQLERGGQWLSWTEGERNAYVYGLISGYLTGSLEACRAADDLFEVGQPHSLGDEHHPSEVPSARCLAKRDDYSDCKLTPATSDCGAYTKVITEFYTKHPEFRGIPFVNLIRLLSDRNRKTADELFQMAQKGALRPVR